MIRLFNRINLSHYGQGASGGSSLFARKPTCHKKNHSISKLLLPNCNVLSIFSEHWQDNFTFNHVQQACNAFEDLSSCPRVCRLLSEKWKVFTREESVNSWFGLRTQTFMRHCLKNGPFLDLIDTWWAQRRCKYNARSKGLFQQYLSKTNEVEQM